MGSTVTYALLCFVAFLIGAIPTGYVVGRVYGVDIRKHGSGNIGATNAGRLLGKKAGIATFVGDAAKGFFAAAIPTFTIPLDAEFISPFTTMFSLLGHCYSPFLKFHGGKGVATGFGGFLYVTPGPVFLSGIVFELVRKIFGYVSLGSISAAITFVLLVFLNVGNNFNLQTKAAAAICAFVILIRHQENLTRLAHHEEPGSKKRPDQGKANSN